MWCCPPLYHTLLLRKNVLRKSAGAVVVCKRPRTEPCLRPFDCCVWARDMLSCLSFVDRLLNHRREQNGLPRLSTEQLAVISAKAQALP